MRYPLIFITVHTLYQQRLNTWITRQNALTRLSNTISNLRLLVFIGFIAAAAACAWHGNRTGALCFLAAGAATFIVLVIRHEKTVSEIGVAERMTEVNREALARVDGEWRKFPDTGTEFIDGSHPYSTDLDIFGQGSVFQWINSTGTFKGRKRLAEILSNERFDAAEAEANREAVSELAPLLDWRQDFAARSILLDTCRKDPGPILSWMEDGELLFDSKAKRLFYRLFPFIGPLAGFLGLAFAETWSLFGLWVPLNLAVLLFRYGPVRRMLAPFDRHERTISLYAVLLAGIEERRFTSEKLRALRAALSPENGSPASRAIKKLESRTAMGQAGGNHMLGAILNATLLWNIQAAILLEAWKRGHGRSLRRWLDTIAEIELLSSLSIIRHDNPEWCFAEFTGRDARFSAEGLGHPLIDRNKRICNDVGPASGGSVAIITGSNMSGKTTLLRTIGVNTVLAFAGAPVCARKLFCGTGRLLTSMRITDDLQNGISTFYAELLRIKSIIDAARQHPSIVLIDEIFRGTNTRDRHQAALRVLRRLASLNALTAISTHDLDLADLENEAPGRYGNFHFSETYRDSKIHFDYRLRPGRSTTSNALRLLEMVGITDGE